MSKEIHYTLNGAVPTIDSPLYTVPFTLTKSTKIRSVKIDTVTGLSSVPVDSYIGVGMPTNLYIQKYYLCHLMVDLGGFASAPEITNQAATNGWIERIKAQGYNLIWLHLEDYSATDSTYSYNAHLLMLMNACEAAGISFMTGISYGGSSVEQKVRLFQDTWNHPAILKIEGRRVYTDYYSFPFMYQSLHDALDALDMSDYYYISGTLFPTSNNGVNTNWQNEVPSGDGDYDSWTVISGIEVNALEHCYETRPFDGVITFNNNQNNEVRKVSNKMFRFGFGDNNHFYNSFAFSDNGFSGSAAIWDEVLSHAPEDRIQGICDITANDMIEATYMAELCNTPEDGLAYIPRLGSGFNLGSHFKYPMVDHSGMQYFLRPWVDAFLNNEMSPTFDVDRIFGRHTLHPVHASARTKIPYALLNEEFLTQDEWNNYFYSDPFGYTPVAYFIYSQATTEPIKMAVHLTAPAILKINDSISDIKQAGPAYFEIPLDDFLGTPYFAILEIDGVTVRKEGYSQQAIISDCWPGGWGLLVQEVNPNNLSNPTPPIVVCDDELNTITASHELGDTEIEYSIGHTNWKQYTGPIQIGEVNTPMGFFRFRVKAASGRNASIVADSAAFTGSGEYSDSLLGEVLTWTSLSTGMTVDSETGSLTADVNNANKGATCTKKLGGPGSWIQFLLKGAVSIKISDSNSNSNYGTSPTINFANNQINPTVSEPTYHTNYVGKLHRFTVADNGLDLIISRSVSNGVRFFDQVGILTNILSGLTTKYIQVYTNSNNDGYDGLNIVTNPLGYNLIS